VGRKGGREESGLGKIEKRYTRDFKRGTGKEGKGIVGCEEYREGKREVRMEFRR